MDRIELSVPVFKRGDDVGAHLSRVNGRVMDALRGYREQLRGAVAFMDAVLEHLADAEDGALALDADTHMVVLTAPDAIAEKLVADELACRLNDEDCEEEENPEGAATQT